ncbi:MAG: cyclase [Betaproteobacteria bacterium RIFCSPLOWO2_02_FULL_67_26]|nr:MAG: cyclase [Betaproteobacteria bacterium RIFCSPLOWO2_02_FULL_67_26]
MSKRWNRRPDGSNWGEFGDDDQRGRMNLLTDERRLRALKEAKTGRAFCLAHPLDRPGGNVLNPNRYPPVFHPVMRDGQVYFNLPFEKVDPRFTDVGSDEAVMLYTQYATHWDGFPHKGSQFDADGDGVAENVFYNGFHIVDRAGRGTQGELGAVALGIQGMAETGVQGRGVLIDLRRRYGDERVEVGYAELEKVMQSDGVKVEKGDIVCVHTGLGQLIRDADGRLDPSIRTRCAVLDGYDKRLLEWIADSGLAAIACDNLAVERSSTLGADPRLPHRGPALPLHEHCLFKLGIHLGELWYLTELAAWLREHRRSRFLLTAPPLRLPGAAGSPVTPVATV